MLYGLSIFKQATTNEQTNEQSLHIKNQEPQTVAKLLPG